MASVLFDAASVWQKRTELKSHYLDGLSASADSDYHVVLVSLRALFNRAGLAAHFSAQGDVADLELKAAPFTRAPGQAQHLAKWTQDRVHLEALLIGVLKEFLASSGDGRLAHLLTDVVTWASATAALESAFLGTPELVLRQVGLRTTALRTAAGSFSSAVTAQDALALVARVELLLLAGSLLRDHLVRELATHTAVVAGHATHTAAFNAAPAGADGDAARAAATAALAGLDLGASSSALVVLPSAGELSSDRLQLGFMTELRAAFLVLSNEMGEENSPYARFVMDFDSDPPASFAALKARISVLASSEFRRNQVRSSPALSAAAARADQAKKTRALFTGMTATAAEFASFKAEVVGQLGALRSDLNAVVSAVAGAPSAGAPAPSPSPSPSPAPKPKTKASRYTSGTRPPKDGKPGEGGWRCSMNGLSPAHWHELKRLMKDGVPGLPISQGGNWDVTEHGVGGLYGQTPFAARPAGAPSVDPRFAPGAPLVAGLRPHYAVGAPAPAPSSLGGAALPFAPPAAPSAGGLPASVVSAFAPASAPAEFSFGALPASLSGASPVAPPSPASFGALPASLSGAPPVAPPSPAPFVPPPPGLPPAGGLPAWAQDPALASFLGDPPDLNASYEEKRAPPPLASLVSSPPRPPVVTQPRPTPYRDLNQARRDYERTAISDGVEAEGEQIDMEENTPGATPVCPWASWIEYGLFTE